MSELIDAVEENNIYRVRLLLEHGAEVDIQDNDGGTALILASGNGNINIVKLLLVTGADPNFKNIVGDTALDMAIYMNETLPGQDLTEIVNLLQRSMATIRIQKRFKTRRKYRTQKAKQMSAFSRGFEDPESILTQSFRWNPNIIEDIGQRVKYYQNVMDRTRQEEQDEERMQLYTEWLQDHGYA